MVTYRRSNHNDVVPPDLVPPDWFPRTLAEFLAFRAKQPFPVEAVLTQSAKAAFGLVLARAGAKVRGEDDLRVIQDVNNSQRTSP